MGFLINGFGTFLPVFIVLYLTRAGYPPLQAARGLSAYGSDALLGPALGHVMLGTTPIYAKWRDKRLRETLGRW